MNTQTETVIEPKTTTKPKKRAKPKAQSRALAVHRATPPAAPPSNMLQVIANAVADPRCDVAKMQALLDMQKQIEEREERKAFTVAFNHLQAELPVINKDGKIDHSVDGGSTTRSGRRALKTSYATWPNLNRVVGPLLKKHGFTFSTFVEPAPDGTMFVISTLEHVSGGSRSTRFKLGADATGGKNNQQGWGSSQQYGMRYNMIALLNIVSEAKEDADNDGFVEPTLISPAQLIELNGMAEEADANIERFCELMKVETMADIPASRFAEAKAQLNRKLVAKKKAASDFPGDRK